MSRISRTCRLVLVAVLGAALLPVLSTLLATPAAAESNGLAGTPLMGWSSWSFLRSAPSAAKIDAQADAMKNSGLSGYGYDHINLDDFYYICNGGTGPAVDANGYWQTDPSKFPPSGSTNGIQVVAAHVHADGLKFGLYVTPGIAKAAVAAHSPIKGTTNTADQIAEPSVNENNYNCGGMVGINYSASGAQAYINGWADQLAAWGVDYLKLDGVGAGDIPDVQAWSTALKQSGRPIALELSNSLSISDATTWESLANGWRTGGDVECYCSSGTSYPLTDYANVSQRFDSAASWQPYGQPGGWNDFDSIEVGNGNNDGLTPAERQTQLSLWAMADSPLLLGIDLTNLDSTDLGLLKNRGVIAIDQDTIPAARVVDSGSEQVFSKRETNGTFDIAVFNTDSGAAHSESVSLPALGLSGSSVLTDVWSGSSLGTVSGTYTATVPAGGVSLITASPVSGNGGTGELVGSQSGKCLDTTGGEVYLPGTAEEIWDCHGGIGQEFTPTSSGELRTVGATECLDVFNNETAPGTKVELWPCNGQANQQWTLESDGTVRGVQSGLCLDVFNQETADGTALDIWNCNGQGNQKWALES
jgi:alpha-galactosidase